MFHGTYIRIRGINILFVFVSRVSSCARKRHRNTRLLKNQCSRCASSSLQRKNIYRLYRCKRKKENQGTRRKYERNNVSGALNKVVDAEFFSYELCRVPLNNLLSFFSSFNFSLSYFRPFPVLTVAKMHPYPSCFARFFFFCSLFPLTQPLSINHAQPTPPLISFSISTFSLSLSPFLSFSFTLSRSHQSIISYVITGGRHPMSISPGMRDERFPIISTILINLAPYRLFVAQCSSIRLQ